MVLVCYFCFVYAYLLLILFCFFIFKIFTFLLFYRLLSRVFIDVFYVNYEKLTFLLADFKKVSHICRQ